MAKQEIMRGSWLHKALILTLAGIFLCGYLPLFGLTMGGFALTFLRGLTPLIALAILVFRIRQDGKVFTSRSSATLFGFFVFWAFWGALLYFLSPQGRPTADSIDEILTITLAGMGVYAILELVKTEKALDLFMKAVKWFTVGLVLFCIVEIIFGIHVPWSIYAHDYYYLLYIDPDKTTNLPTLHYASGLLYNPNDLSATLVTLAPSLFYSRHFEARGKESRNKRIFSLTIFALLIVVLSVNDSTIATLSLLMGLIAYLVVARKTAKHALTIFGVFIFAREVLARFIAWALVKVDELRGPLQATVPDAEFFALSERVLSQLASQSETGTVTLRLEMYINTLKAWWQSQGMGLGPNGLLRYFDQNPLNSGLMDPHNWFLELLGNYGVFVFAFYIGLIIFGLVVSYKAYKRYDNKVALVLFVMLIIFVPASMGPSSYLKSLYPWIPITLSLTLLQIYKPNGSGKGEVTRASYAID